MDISNIISAIGQAFRKKEVDRRLSVAELARSIADGKPVDATKVAEALDAAGQTPDDLQKATDRIIQRRGLLAKVKAADGVAAKRAELTKKADAIRATYNAALRKFEEDMLPVQVAAKECDRLEFEANTAKNKLGEDVTADVEEQAAVIQAKIAALNRELEGRMRSVKEAGHEVEKWKAAAASPQKAHFNPLNGIADNDDRPRVSKEYLRNAEVVFAKLTAESQEIEKARHDLQAEKDALYEAAAKVA
jgi:hypothetical protein